MTTSLMALYIILVLGVVLCDVHDNTNKIIYIMYTNNEIYRKTHEKQQQQQQE